MKKGKNRYTEQELCTSLQKLAKKLGHTPTAAEINRDKNTPSYPIYHDQYGSLKNAIASAGLQSKSDYSQQCMIEYLQKLAKKLGHAPTYRDLISDRSGYHPSTIARKLGNGSLHNALITAGFEHKTSKRDYTEREMIRALRRLAKELGHAPTTVDLNNCPYTPTAPAYGYRFGSLKRALEIAHIK